MRVTCDKKEIAVAQHRNAPVCTHHVAHADCAGNMLSSCHVQEAAGQTEAAVSRAQQELQQGQQQLQQQQQNLVAMRAQIQQLDCRCDASSASNSQLQRLLRDLQDQTDSLSRDVAVDHDQLLLTQAGLESARAALQDEVQQAVQQLTQQLQQQQWELAQCAGAAGGALDKCEQLRQGAVVLAGRLDGVPGQVQAAVQPLQDRWVQHPWHRALKVNASFQQVLCATAVGICTMQSEIVFWQVLLQMLW
jgi:uncharacterized protein (DUF3084 family)